MNSPFANMYNAISARIALKVPAVKWIDTDIGQLENYGGVGYKPAVNWPCALIDFDEWTFEDVTDNIQIGTGVVVIRSACTPYSNTSAITPQLVKDMGLLYYDIDQALYEALNGWTAAPFSLLARRSTRTERRNDNIRVRVSRYQCIIKDLSAQPVRQKIAVPTPVVLSATLLP
jgi:hypothetical protein